MLGERIKQRREEIGISLQELADKCGCRKQSVFQWEKGDFSPSSEFIRKISLALNVSSDWLLGLIDEMKPLAGEESKDVKIIGYLQTSSKGNFCSVEHCAWRVNCGGGKFYCPGAGCMKAVEESMERKKNER